MNKKFKILFFINIILLVSLANCSYVMDSIEASITERSSFSISGSYDSDTHTVNLSWTDDGVNPGSEPFAGYEIYMTEKSDNEFSGYTVISAPYDLGESTFTSVDDDGNIDEIEFPINYDNMLRRDSEKTGLIALNPEFTGVLFFRVGIIYWNKSTKVARSGEHDDNFLTTGWMPYNYGGTEYWFVEYTDINHPYDDENDNQWFYVNSTNLSSISGSLMIVAE